MISKSTKKCLTSDKKSNVFTFACLGTKYQKWIYSKKRLINMATNECLDLRENGRVFTSLCGSSKYQIWNLVENI